MTKYKDFVHGYGEVNGYKARPPAELLPCEFIETRDFGEPNWTPPRLVGHINWKTERIFFWKRPSYKINIRDRAVGVIR